MKNVRWALLAAAISAATPGFGQMRGDVPGPLGDCHTARFPGRTKSDTVETVDGRSRLLDSVGFFGLNVDLSGRRVEKMDGGIRIWGEYDETDGRGSGRIGNGTCYGIIYVYENIFLLNIPDAELRDWGYVYMPIETGNGKTVDALVPLEELKNSSERVVEKAITGRADILRTLVRKARTAVRGREGMQRARKAAESIIR